jgi:small subunit ribosomal protein S20
MANIKQQKKRVRTAARERLENLRYRSTIKTLSRRLGTAVDEGSDTVEAEYRGLVRMIDKAAARGAIHKNAAARKKSQATRLLTAEPAAVEPKSSGKSSSGKSSSGKSSSGKSRPKSKA